MADPAAHRRIRLRFRVITFDRRGIGHSTEGDEPLRATRGLARDVLVVLQPAGVPRAHVSGHSMGGRVAQWLAIDAPDAASAIHDAWGELRDMHVPTLAVHGSGDAITPPENGRALAALIPRAEYLEVAGARHAPHIGHPACSGDRGFHRAPSTPS